MDSKKEKEAEEETRGSTKPCIDSPRAPGSTGGSG
jgi:hypothetical protein